jgi:tetratricopeptide (TPR) repeat protein
MKKSIIQIWLYLLVLLAFISTARGSATSLDSLWNLATHEQEVLKQNELLIEYAKQLCAVSSDDGIALCDSLIDYYEVNDFQIPLGRTMSIKAWFLNFQSRYKEGLELGYDALKILEKQQDTLGVALTVNRIGITNVQLGRFDEVQQRLNKALEIFTSLKDTARMDMVLNNLGVVAQEQNKSTEALGYYKKSLVLRKKMGNPHWLAYIYSNIANSFKEAERLDSALKYTDLALETFQTKTKRKRVPALAACMAGNVYLEVRDTANALKWGLYSLKDAEEVSHTEVVIFAKTLLSEVYAMKGEHEKAYILLKQYTSAKASLDSANNAAAVAEIEGKYNTAEKERELIRVNAAKTELESKARKYWIFALIALLLVLVVSGLVVFVHQQNRQKRKLDQAKFNTQLSEIKLTALRAQMNPHFIFNCINTAQNFVLHADKAMAYEYLANFAKLLRLVLENANKNTAPLEDELKQLELYVGLEAERFKEKFSYTIKVDNDLKNGIYEIPSMLIQPLVENALLHGLMNRGDNEGKLEIQFKKQGSNMHCVIRDNGVGRKEAATIKAHKKVHYQSAAMPNIKERLDILRQTHGAQIKLEITDLEESGNALGTQADLYLPLV